MNRIIKLVIVGLLLSASTFGVYYYCYIVHIEGTSVKISRLKKCWEGFPIEDSMQEYKTRKGGIFHLETHKSLSSNPGANFVARYGYVIKSDEEYYPVHFDQGFIELYTIRGKLIYRKGLGQRKIYRPLIFANGNMVFETIETKDAKTCKTEYLYYDQKGGLLNKISGKEYICNDFSYKLKYPFINRLDISPNAKTAFFVRNLKPSLYQLLKITENGGIIPFAEIKSEKSYFVSFSPNSRGIVFHAAKISKKNQGRDSYLSRTIYFFSDYDLKWKTTIEAEYFNDTAMCNSITGKYLFNGYWTNAGNYLKKGEAKDRPTDLFKVIDTETGKIVYDGPDQNGIIAKYLVQSGE